MRLFRFSNRTRKGRTTRHPIFGGPRPLILDDQNIVLSWSAKSGSVQILLWYLIQTGLLEEAKAHCPWPHNYRMDVLLTSGAYQAWAERFIAEGAANYTLVKFMRDPMQRCVSSYRHALRNGYADADMELILDQPINHRFGYPYRQYLEYLSAVDLENTNPHHKFQYNTIDSEMFGQKILIYVEQNDLYTSLNLLEKKYHLNHTDFGEFDEFGIWATAHHAKDARQEFRLDTIIDRRFSKLDAEKRWPKVPLERCGPAREWVREIYQADYAAARRLESSLLMPPSAWLDGDPCPPNQTSDNHAPILSPLERFTHRRKQQITRLVDAARVAVHRAPSSSIYHYHRANEMISSGRLQAAEKELRSAIKLDPGLVEYHFRLSEALVLMERTDEAVAAARTGVDLDPGNAMLRYQLGFLYVRNRDFENALTQQRKAVELEPQEGLFYYRAAQSLDALKRLNDATNEARIAVNLDPGSALFHHFLGNLLLNDEQYLDALTEMRAAVDLGPDVAVYHRSLSWALRLLGQYDEAVEAAKRAVILLPDDAELQENLDKLRENS